MWLDSAVIPALDPNGHLPPGRYPSSVDEVEAVFVKASSYQQSVTRARIWHGFLNWLDAWRLLEEQEGVQLLHGVWVAGSFVSDKLDPSDIDISPLVDGEAARQIKGRRGAGVLKRLIGHRESVIRQYNVEPFPVAWVPVEHSFRVAQHTIIERDYLVWRGTMDDWWQRVKPPGGGAPAVPACSPERGYVEVML